MTTDGAGGGCRGVLVLMYHSISDGPGPTCIAPEVFRDQMAALEELDYRVVPLSEVPGWMRGTRALPPRCACLTFDDGFADFASDAAPVLRRIGWPSTVFLPVGHVGGADLWEPPTAGGRRRRLMDWPTIAGLAADGVEFGAHGVSHRDLSRLRGQELEAEVCLPRRVIEQRIGRAVTSFAAPYGRADAAAERLVRRQYRRAVGTTFGRARRGADPYAIPRIEMHYFRQPDRWRSFLRGDARAYVLARRLMRGARGIVAAGRPVVPAGCWFRSTGGLP